MITVKDWRKCLGRGFAVWDPQWRVARKYKCVAVLVRHGEGEPEIEVLTLQRARGWYADYKAEYCFDSRGAALDAAMGSRGDWLVRRREAHRRRMEELERDLRKLTADLEFARKCFEEASRDVKEFYRRQGAHGR